MQSCDEEPRLADVVAHRVEAAGVAGAAVFGALQLGRHLAQLVAQRTDQDRGLGLLGIRHGVIVSPVTAFRARMQTQQGPVAVDGTGDLGGCWRAMIAVTEQTLLAEIGRRLTQEFPGVAPEVVDAAIRQAHARFANSPIRDFIPLFVEKHARRQLRAPVATNA